MATPPLAGSGATGRAHDAAVDSHDTSSSDQAPSTGWVMQQGGKGPSWQFGGTSGPPVITRISGPGLERVRRHHADSSDGSGDETPEPRPRGLWKALASVKGAIQGAGVALGGGALALGGMNALELWMQTQLLNSVPMVGWGLTAAAGAGLLGWAGVALAKYAHTPEGSNAPQDPPDTGTPRNGEDPVPKPADRRRRRRGLSTAGKVVSAATGVAAGGALLLALQGAFAGAGLALPPAAIGVGAAAAIGLIGHTITRFLRKK